MFLATQEKKRQIILENFNNPVYQVSLIELKKVSQLHAIPFSCFRSSNNGCGDVVYLLLIPANNSIQLALFASDQQACCLTISSANILCHWMRNKKIDLIKEEIINLEKMLQGQKYQLLNCHPMEIFQDLKKSPRRLECVNLVVRGIKLMIYQK